MTDDRESQSGEGTRFQFHLSSLLIAVTLGCVVFAMIGRFGVDGFIERIGVALSVVAIFDPLIDVFRWWKANMDDG